MNELRNSKNDDQLEELLMLTEQMQEELDQKDRTIRKLKVQLDESLTLNEVKQREQNREHSSLKERLEENKRIVAERERENTHRPSHDRGMSR